MLSKNSLVQFAQSAVCQTHGLLLEKTELSPVKRAYFNLQRIADGQTENPLAEFLSAKKAIIYAEKHYLSGSNNDYEIRAFHLIRKALNDYPHFT